MGEHHLGPAVLWRSGAAGVPAGLLEVGADGDVVLRGAGMHGAGAPLWSTRTGGWPGAMLKVSDDGIASVRTVSGRVLWTAGASTPDVGLAGVRHVVYGRSAQRVWMIGTPVVVLD